MLYPSVSDWWNRRVQSYAIANYNDAVQQIAPETYDDIWNAAYNYNSRLNQLASPFAEHDKLSDYDEVLNIGGSGIMGYISIPVINVELPIYHGTSAEVLNIAAGHLEGSSLPVGGKNTHAVISAHRGLPSAKLFTDLDELVIGDTFTITVLNDILTYEIDDIVTVEPEQTDKLEVIPDGDYVTLMTCTPYGINSHRMLVRAKRIETVYERNVRVDQDARKVDPMLVIPFIAAPLVLILIIFWFFGNGRKPRKRTRADYLNLVSSKGG
ncbi:MAG: class C sortase [Ruminococcus flavefaciens]|nr:class C sortase [Ruminococcus flavefaciens]